MRKSFLRRTIDHLYDLILEEWGEYKNSPEEIREQLKYLQDIRTEVRERNL